MYRTILSFAICAFTSLLLISCGSEKKTEESSTNKGRTLEPAKELSFLRADGSEISTIRVVVADDPAERNQGLMDVNSMPMDVGMLFIFETEEPLSFYMANTPLSLDIAFVNADSTIVRIHHNTAPFSSEQLSSEQPAQFVVETNAGYCVSNDIQEGTKIRF